MKRFFAGALALALALVAVVVGAPSGGALTETLTFSATLDPAVASGQWLLTTYGGVNEDVPILLGTGDVPTTGALRIEVPLATLATSTSNYFVLRALKVLDHDRGKLASVSQGLLPAALRAGATIELGHAVTVDTLINEAQAAAPTTPADSIDPGTLEPVASKAFSTPKIAVAPTLGGMPALSLGITDPTEPQPAGIMPTQNCHYTRCNDDTVAPPSGGGNPDNNRPQCYSTWYSTNDCLMNYQDDAGRLVLRGYGQRPIGAFDTFQVEFSNVQEWDNGFRVQSGPFQVDGHTMRQFTSSSLDKWPERGDCWSPPHSGDRNCATDATEGNYGRDTWRWERHRVYYCSGAGSYCNYVDEERYRERSHDGGTEIPSPGSPGNSYYYERPSLITHPSEPYGSWSSYLPGSKHEFFLGNEYAHSNAASMTIEPPSGWGKATFSSSMTNKTLNKTTNVLTLRSDLPWMGKWYRYDGGLSEKPWQKEYWSCEWTPGWSGGEDCWEQGS